MAENKSSNNSVPTVPGFRVDPRFINLRPLGHGGNGVVYAATDSDCDKEVAIKKLTFQVCTVINYVSHSTEPLICTFVVCAGK